MTARAVAYSRGAFIHNDAYFLCTRAPSSQTGRTMDASRAAGDVHVKANLSIKRIMIAKAVYAAALRFNLPPSQLVLLDLCASYGKDYESVVRVGISPRNYIGFDCSEKDVELGNRICNVGGDMKALYYCDITNASDAHRRMSLALQERQLPPAHVVLCNFAVHHFESDSDMFKLIDPNSEHGGVTQEGCALVCALCDESRVRALASEVRHEDGGATARGVTVAEVTIESMARYELKEGGLICAMVNRAPHSKHDGQGSGGRYFKAGVDERAVSLATVIVAGRQWRFSVACAHEVYDNYHIFVNELYGDGGWASVRRLDPLTYINLSRFLKVHATPIFTHLPYATACRM
jgi:hypothetical protein